MEITGKDLDEKSTAQNFINVARQGDISPRQMEKGKAAAKGKKKKVKDNPSGPTTLVQTRRTLTKPNNL